MPGRLLQGIRQAGTRNPVVLLDEIDKLVADSHGDPAAALLEVLDPEQNHSFQGSLPGRAVQPVGRAVHRHRQRHRTLSPELRDRLEILTQFGWPPKKRSWRLPPATSCRGAGSGRSVAAIRCRLPRRRCHRLIVGYTLRGRRARTRTPDWRGVPQNCPQHRRACGMRWALSTLPGIHRPTATYRQSIVVSERALERYLGPPDARWAGSAVAQYGAVAPEIERVGTAIGLAWTPVGGEVLEVESQCMPGRGELRLTGQLGEVMRESAQTALSPCPGPSLGWAEDPSRSGQNSHSRTRRRGPQRRAVSGCDLGGCAGVALDRPAAEPTWR